MGNDASECALRYFTNVVMPKNRTVAVRAATRGHETFLAKSCVGAEELCLRLAHPCTQLHQLNANSFQAIKMLQNLIKNLISTNST